MKLMKLLVITFITMSAYAGGDYGGGPKIVALNRLDYSVNFKDIKLTRDRESVELILSYKKRSLDFDPFVSERDGKLLQFGKYAEVRVKFDKDQLPQRVIDELNERSKFTIFTAKYKKLVQENFTINEVTEQMNTTPEKRYYEIQVR